MKFTLLDVDGFEYAETSMYSMCRRKEKRLKRKGWLYGIEGIVLKLNNADGIVYDIVTSNMDLYRQDIAPLYLVTSTKRSKVGINYPSANTIVMYSSMDESWNHDSLILENNFVYVIFKTKAEYIKFKMSI